MSGGYVSCGKWLGDDKSCSAFLPLLDVLETLVDDAERAEWDATVAAPLKEQLDRTPEDDMPFLRLTPATMVCLSKTVRRYVARELARGIVAEPDETDDGSGWRSGPGWRLYCAVDLVRAYEHCVATGNEVVIHFD